MKSSTTFRPWLVDTEAVRAAGAKVVLEGGREVEIRSRFVAALPGGLRVADARMVIRIDVTAMERAAGAFKGESRDAIAGRETVATAVATASDIMDAIAAFEGRVVALRAEMEKIIIGAEIEGSDRNAWRARALACEIRDMIDDHPGAGTTLVLRSRPKDLLTLSAYVPAGPGADLRLDGLSDRVLRALQRDGAARAVDLLLEVRDVVKPVYAGAPDVFTEPLASDIALMTGDMAIRHLLQEAADLRHRAAEYSAADPDKAADVMAAARDVESRALRALAEADGSNAANDLIDSSTALSIQADMKFNR